MIDDVRAPRAYPGLVKIRSVPLLTTRSVSLCAVNAGRLQDLFERADVVSEGRTEMEGGRAVYYGSTSVLLLRCSEGGALPDVEVARLAALLGRDPHVRIHALRIAHREATARAGAPIGTLMAEIDVGAGARGVSLLVEVVARLARPEVRAGAAER